jgi:hypothetical protein
MIYPVIYYSKHGNRARFCDLILLAATVDFFFRAACSLLLFPSRRFHTASSEQLPTTAFSFLCVFAAGTGDMSLDLTCAFHLSRGDCTSRHGNIWPCACPSLCASLCLVDGQSGYAALCARWRIWLCCTVHSVEDFLLQICRRAAHKCVPVVFLRQG